MLKGISSLFYAVLLVLIFTGIGVSGYIIVKQPQTTTTSSTSTIAEETTTSTTVMAIQTCSDGTSYGQCSIFKPKICDNGKLINKCSICGCQSSIFYDCTDNGNCNKKNYVYPNCRGITCYGFCYNSRFEMDCIEDSFVEADPFIPEIRPCRDDSDCEPYVYNERTINTYCNKITHRCSPYKVEADLELKAPESVPMNSEFSFSLSITNEKDSSIDIQIDPPLFMNAHGMCPDDGTGLCYRYKNESDTRQVTLSPQETRELTYRIKTGDPSMTAKILINTDFGVSSYSNPIIVYDPSETIAKCGNKVYNERNIQAICIDSILYPTKNCITGDCIYETCYSNDNCGSGVCFDHSCVAVYSSSFEPVKPYKVSVTPLYLSSDITEINEQKANIPLNVSKMIKDANDWFKSEKSYWESTSDFSVEYNLVECDIRRNEYLKILRESESADWALNNVAKECLIDRKKYPIVVFSFVYGKDFDQELSDEMGNRGFVVSMGQNFGDSIITGYASYSVLIHETLHSFGMFDIYAYMGTPAENYHLHDCILFRAMWDQFEKNPHLCPIEAFVIGWLSPEIN